MEISIRPGKHLLSYDRGIENKTNVQNLFLIIIYSVLSRGWTGHAGETAIFMWEIGVKCGRFITLFLMLNISTDLP